MTACSSNEKKLTWKTYSLVAEGPVIGVLYPHPVSDAENTHLLTMVTRENHVISRNSISAGQDLTLIHPQQ